MAPKRKLKEELRIEEGWPTAVDINNETYFTRIAQRLWLKSKKASRVKPEVLKNEIWDVLERESFEFRFLLAFDNLQILERSSCSASPNCISCS